MNIYRPQLPYHCLWFQSCLNTLVASLVIFSPWLGRVLKDNMKVLDLVLKAKSSTFLALGFA